MKMTTMLLSSLLFFFSSLGFAANDYQTNAKDDRAQVTSTTASQGATAVCDFVGNDGELNHSCSCEGTQACSVSCAYDKSAKCGKDIYGYCSCSCS